MADTLPWVKTLIREEAEVYRQFEQACLIWRYGTHSQLHWFSSLGQTCGQGRGWSVKAAWTSLPDVKVWNSEDAEDEVLAMVVRVKLDTTMGSMVRQLIAPVSAMQEKVSFETVSGLYLLVMHIHVTDVKVPRSQPCKRRSFRNCKWPLSIGNAFHTVQVQCLPVSAAEQKISFETVSGFYLLETDLHAVTVKVSLKSFSNWKCILSIYMCQSAPLSAIQERESLPAVSVVYLLWLHVVWS